MAIETLGRKYARFVYWNHLRKQAMGRAFEAGIHLLVGTNAGQELSSPVGFGVIRPIAVEPNEEVAFIAHEEHPYVKVICGDPIAIAKEYRRKVMSALVSLEGPVEESTVRMLSQLIIHGLKDSSFLGVFVEHHENDYLSTLDEKDPLDLSDREMLEVIAIRLKNAPEACQEIREVILRGNKVEMEKVVSAYRKKHFGTSISSSVNRLSRLSFTLQDMLDAHRVMTAPALFVNFTEDVEGARRDFSYILICLERVSRSMPEDRFDRRKYNFSVEHLTEVVDCGIFTEEKLTHEVLTWLDFLRETQDKKRMSAEDADALIHSTPRMFNLDKELVAQWVMSAASEPTDE